MAPRAIGLHGPPSGRLLGPGLTREQRTLVPFPTGLNGFLSWLVLVYWLVANLQP